MMPNSSSSASRRSVSQSPRQRSRPADSRAALVGDSPDMHRLLKRGYRLKQRPSGHNITRKFKENGDHRAVSPPTASGS
jgi:hypothetical protein